MARWIKYLNERSPIPALLLISANLAYAGLCLSGELFSWSRFVPVTLAITLFFVLIRLMDEYKDYQKDLVAHPERPLARGLIKREEAYFGIRLLAWVMLAAAAAFGCALNPAVGGYYALIAIYLWLMFREFYIGESLGQSPMLYMVSHQFIVIPLYLFPVAAWSSEAGTSPLALAYGVSNVGATMSYEIGRKLDPDAAPILKQYLGIYGVRRCILFIALCNLVAAVGSYYLGYGYLLWPLEGLVLLSSLILIKKPHQHKLVEGITALSSLIHTAAPTIYHFTGWPHS